MADPTAVSDVNSRTAGLAVSLRDVTKVYDNGVKALGAKNLLELTENGAVQGPSAVVEIVG